ncbi:MAG: hypothetical protein HN712_28145 [Gemmatimonadetes bacterium]|jgi:hypothetical protein|nr:hypothetical protein [Gemmatimonadota bacterium]MBT6148099.1 hypothetical protein [Gemmatimonadota bacterium]MBT7864215.1 hypothetical protein [Gemmatimonadota bacterium]
MSDKQARAIPKAMAVGLSFSLVAILFGFVLGGVFGSAESSIKKCLDDAGIAVLESVYEGDVAAKDAVVQKSWAYLKRAHLHGGAIGAAALGCIVALIVVCRRGMLAQLSALAIGSGALIYAVFWLLAGFAAPGMGSTGAAKESLSYMAIPGAGLCILGLCGTLYSVVKECFYSEMVTDE